MVFLLQQPELPKTKTCSLVGGAGADLWDVQSMLLPGPSTSSRPGISPAQLAATTTANSLWLTEQAEQVERMGRVGRACCVRRNQTKRGRRGCMQVIMMWLKGHILSLGLFHFLQGLLLSPEEGAVWK